jgi:hypothetical protein
MNDKKRPFYDWLEVPYYYRHYMNMGRWQAVVVSASFSGDSMWVYDADGGALAQTRLAFFPRPHSHLTALTPTIFVSEESRGPFWLASDVPVVDGADTDFIPGFYFDGVGNGGIRDGEATPVSLQSGDFVFYHPLVSAHVFGGIQDENQYKQGNVWMIKGNFGEESLDQTDHRILRLCIHGGFVSLAKSLEDQIEANANFDDFDFVYGGYTTTPGLQPPPLKTPVGFNAILSALAEAEEELGDLIFATQEVFLRLYNSYRTFMYINQLVAVSPPQYNPFGNQNNGGNCGVRPNPLDAIELSQDANFRYCVPYYASSEATDVFLDIPAIPLAQWKAFFDEKPTGLVVPRGSSVAVYPFIPTDQNREFDRGRTKCEKPESCSIVRCKAQMKLGAIAEIEMCLGILLGNDVVATSHSFYTRDRVCKTVIKDGDSDVELEVQLPAAPFFGSFTCQFHTGILRKFGGDEDEGEEEEEFKKKRSIEDLEDAEETLAATGTVVVTSNTELTFAAPNVNPGGVQSRKRVLQTFSFGGMFPLVKGSCL